jgi:hypothetical protein
MRIAQKIIATFLALQLLVSFGLCGGLCCVLSQKTAAHPEVATAIQEDSLASHCPIHAEKARVEKAKREQLAKKARQFAQQNLKAKLPVSSFNRSNCCLVRANLPEGEIASISASPQPSKLLALYEPSLRCLAVVSDLPVSSRDIFHLPTASPPTGFQLSLRI